MVSRGTYCTYRVLLLIHDVVIHFRSKDPAFVEEPSLLGLTYSITEFHIIFGLGHPVQEGQASTNFVVDFFKYFVR